ncbi:ribonuclease Z [Halolamina pelagica]|uniref:Ribonuclease Z n=1 Tax=Halolamina pelagica TaxID=699431 RepID=A0A0P7GTD9_9EURY|nr:MBL fold metallo-hydrolase [Halolamina pelagica]KPN32231.1 ribonuclease Z [Halolamina pelagica]
MRVTLLGTGSAMPLPDRVQTGLLLERDDRALLVDCGAGVLHRLSTTDVGYEGVSTVLLTHHHLDHVNDLLALLKARWLAGETHLEVVGPTGTKALVDDLLSVHDYLDGRVDLSIREVGAGTEFEAAGFEISTHETVHSMDCLAYRFAGDDGGDDFTFGADGEASASIARFADGSDTLLHDCSFPDEVDVDNHPTPTQLGEALAGTDIDRLLLTHLYPHTEGKHDEMIESIERAGFDGDVSVAEDGLRFEV